MSKSNQKEKKSGKRAPARPKKLIELTEKDLEQVQGGSDGSNSAYKEMKWNW